MKFYKPNIEKSRQLLSKYPNLIEPNECYTNVANLVVQTIDGFTETKGLEVVFGGVETIVGSNIYSKHAFFLLDDLAIDPTVAIKGLKEEIRFFVVKKMTINEYRNYLATHEHTFPVDMQKKFNKVSAELLTRNILLVG